MINAKIIADSINIQGNRLTTLELEYPRFIHGELMTHRVFSRNAASSRAIPVKVMLDQVRSNPVIPIKWGSNQAGMQTGEELATLERKKAQELWKDAAVAAAYYAESLQQLGLHKSLANRLLEPFQWMRTIVTATEWNNFFELRDHPDAEVHFQVLAQEIRTAICESVPVLRGAASFDEVSWHLPYVSDEERENSGALQLAKVSAARCARVSYLTHDGQNPSLEKDLALYERLAGGRPIHASPLEHQAISETPGTAGTHSLRSNLVGWIQFRKLVENNNA